MKRWILLAAACYPRNWREQYGEEFRALLDDVKPNWRVFLNVLRGAIKMQITKGNNPSKLAAVMAAGGIVAACASFTLPMSFMSSSVIQVTTEPDPIRSASPQAIQELAADHVTQLEQMILSRSTLAPIILDPALNLYPGERDRIPVERIIMRMRSDIRIQAIPVGSPTTGVSPITLRISFTYPDRQKAQEVVGLLTTEFTRQSIALNRARARMFETFWHDQSAAMHSIQSVPPPTGESLVVIDPARLPEKPVGPNHVAYVAWGVGAGLLAGLMAVLVSRQPRLSWQLGGFAVLGCALAVAASYLITDRYTSTAVLLITPPWVTEDPLATPTVTPARERLSKLEPEVLSRTVLARIIQRPELDLYRKERAKEPLEKIIEKMRNHDIRIAVVNPEAVNDLPSAFSISFSYFDRYKAAGVVRNLVAAFEEVHIAQMRAAAANESTTFRRIEAHKAGENLEVLDPASVPDAPVQPDRLMIGGIGLAAGLLGGVITLRLSSHRHHPLQAEA